MTKKTKRLVATLTDDGGKTEAIRYRSKVLWCYDLADEDLFAALRRRKITHVKHAVDVWGLPAGTHALSTIARSWRGQM